MKDLVIASLIVVITVALLTWEICTLMDRIEWMHKCQKILSRDECEVEYSKLED